MRRSLLVVALGLVALLGAADAGAQATRAGAVDLALILAVDISPSVDAREGALQREGHVAAFRNPKVIKAIQNGRNGRIAVTYVEWSGPSQWRIVADWRVVAGADDALALADQLDRVSVGRGSGTSITSMLGFASSLFVATGVAAERKVIDVSGDGPNSAGGIINATRDALVREGVTINGLPILTDDGGYYNLPDLDVYYEECVIGGPRAFVIAADGFEAFADAILRKLILEIADASPPVPRLIPAQAIGPLLGGPKANARYAPDCDIGEKLRYLDNPTIIPEGLRVPLGTYPTLPLR